MNKETCLDICYFQEIIFYYEKKFKKEIQDSLFLLLL